MRSQMEEMKARTARVLYENFRTERLERDPSALPLSAEHIQLMEHRIQRELHLSKLESDTLALFRQKVKEKEEVRLQQAKEVLS